MKPVPDLQRLKSAARREDALCLEVATADGAAIGTLLLAGSWVLREFELLEQVTQWRQRSMRMFLSQFEPSVSRTAAYFRDIVLAQPDRALFFLLDAQGAAVGHLGIANWTDASAELDNLVRGVGGGHPQLTYHAEQALLQWVFQQSPVRSVFARVLSYNWMAQDLHASLGFAPTQAQSLRKVDTADGVHHEIVAPEDSNVAYRCVVMELTAPAPAAPHPRPDPSPAA